jgi:hypothetical protein
LEAVEVPSRFEIDDELWVEVEPLIERYPEIHTALLVLACSILCWRRLSGLLAQTAGGC